MMSQNIVFLTAPCSLGFILVAATDKGVCSVALGDSAATLESVLQNQFKVAPIRRQNDARLQNYVESLLQNLGGKKAWRDWPLDVRATNFQWRVWQILRSIPYGETRSYLQVAELMNQPQAARAVARACATNPLALFIPCHRVVRSNGSLTGYRWGLERKRKLLEMECQQKDDKNESLVTLPYSAVISNQTVL